VAAAARSYADGEQLFAQPEEPTGNRDQRDLSSLGETWFAQQGTNLPALHGQAPEPRAARQHRNRPMSPSSPAGPEGAECQDGVVVPPPFLTSC